MPIPVNISGNNAYTEFDKINQSLNNLTNLNNVKLGANGLETDNRVKHFIGIGKGKAENQAIEQSTRDLAIKLKNIMLEKFGKQNGSILFNRYISQDNILGKKQITALNVKLLFENAKIFEKRLSNLMMKVGNNAGYQPSTNKLLKSCGIQPQMFRHIMARTATSLDVPSHEKSGVYQVKIGRKNRPTVN